MKLLALDLSTKATGFCVFEDKKIIKYGVLKAGGSDPYERIFKIKEQVKNIYDNYKPDEICIEDVMPSDCGNKQSVFKTLMYLQSTIFLYFYLENKYLPITFATASHWRKNCGFTQGPHITRETLKNESIAYVKSKYNIDVTDDESDAICQGISYYIDQNDGIETQIDLEEKAF